MTQGIDQNGGLLPPNPIDNKEELKSLEAPKLMTMDEADIMRTNAVYAQNELSHEDRLIVLQLRDSAHELSMYMIKHCPSGRERSLALTQLQQTINWACESIRVKY